MKTRQELEICEDSSHYHEEQNKAKAVCLEHSAQKITLLKDQHI